MANYITVDGGTTNTRVSLVCDKAIVDTKKLRLGVGDRDIESLKSALRFAIAELLSSHHVAEREISRILASGMITSEYGLCNLPHVTVPVGIVELHESMYETVLPDVSPIPFVFIRGVKTECTDLCNADMMRGEETELMGILDADDGNTVYVLPGSHSKLIWVDRDGRISNIRTMLTGEMVAALSQHTILSDAVDMESASMDEQALLDGFRYCLEHGINEALFKVRILKNLISAEPSRRYGFFLGAILCGEVQEIVKSRASKIVVSGQSQLSKAIYEILKVCSRQTVVLLDGEAVAASTARGAVKIYEFQNALNERAEHES